MKRLFYLFALVVAIFTFDATAAFGQASLVGGRVLDALDATPIVGAYVVVYRRTTDMVVGAGQTDEFGRFEIAVKERYFSIEILMAGYHSVRLPSFKPYYYDGGYNADIVAWLESATDETYIRRDNFYDILMNYSMRWMNFEQTNY